MAGIDAKLRYPNCALAAVEVDASQLQNIPTRSYRTWGRIVRIPSNCDPLTRSYSGVWDGTFKTGWTNNPASGFFEMLMTPGAERVLDHWAAASAAVE